MENKKNIQVDKKTKTVLIITVIFYGLQVFTRPYLGDTASLFGYLGGFFAILSIFLYLKNRNNKKSS